MIGDLRRDRFGADVLVLWEGSRGSRKVGEWVELIELCEDHTVRIAVTTDERMYDPANARDRKTLLDNATDAEYESAKISARAKRAQAANAAAGRPNGQVPYGYRRRYDEVTRELVAQEPLEAEAAVVRELFERVAAGHSIRSITRDFEARGVRNRSGVPFKPVVLRNMAINEAYRGKRAHTPRSVKMSLQERRRLATVTDAIWPALVPERTWLAVRRILDDPERKAVRYARGQHAFTMIIRCDACSGPLAVTYRKTSKGHPLPAQYFCRDHGCVRIDKAPVDEIVEAAIIGYLSRPDHVDQLTAADGNDEALATVRLEVAELRAELDELADQLGRGKLSAMVVARAEPQILERLRTAERREKELATPSALRGLIEPGDDVAERWDAAPIPAKRRIARLLLTPDVLGELRIARSPTRGHKVPAIDRLVWNTNDDRLQPA